MKYRFFCVDCRCPEEMEQELNGFLASHRVIEVDRQLVSAEGRAFWAVAVVYREESWDGKGGARGRKVSGDRRVDYKELLPPEQFEVFARLRERRKELAAQEGVPVFAVFTNEQLAEMVRTDAKTPQDLGKIEGVGDARVEKYGAAILETLSLKES